MSVKSPPFLNPDSGPTPKKWRNRIWWDVALIVLIFIGLVFVAAGIYCYGSPRGWGIAPTFGTPDTTVITGSESSVDFWDCAHFSIATITTLGYGDYRPVSWGRVVAGVEVTLGLILMGLLISRLISRQQDRLLKRLVHGQINTEIKEFRSPLAELIKGYRSLLIEVRQMDNAVISHRSDLLYRSSGLMQSIARYWRRESGNRDFYDVAQKKNIGRMLGDLEYFLDLAAKVVDSETSSTINEHDRINIRNITESILLSATVIQALGGRKNFEESSCSKIYTMIINLRDKFELKRTMTPKGEDE